MDVKYLSDRYDTGKAAVDKLLAEKHRVARHSSTCMGHTAIVQMQGDMGPDGCLVSSTNTFILQVQCKTVQCKFASFSIHAPTLRLTVLIADATLWPTRACASTTY